MKTFDCFIKKIINKSIIYNKYYLIKNHDIPKIQKYIQTKKLPLIINTYKYNNTSYIEFEKFNKFN